MNSYEKQRAKEAEERYQKVKALGDKMDAIPCPNCGDKSWQIYSFHPGNDLKTERQYGAQCRKCRWDDLKQRVIEVKKQERKGEDTQGAGYKSKVE